MSVFFTFLGLSPDLFNGVMFPVSSIMFFHLFVASLSLIPASERTELDSIPPAMRSSTAFRYTAAVLPFLSERGIV